MAAAAAGRAHGAFGGFLPQITGRLGPVREYEAATAHGGDRGFAVLHLGAPGGEVVAAVTDGLRWHRLGGAHPLELCCTLLTEQAEKAHRIVVQVAEMALEYGLALTSGTIIHGEQPLAPDCEPVGVVCAGRPFIDAEFELVHGADGRVELQILTLIPATAAELALAAEHGADALYTRWSDFDGDLADLARPSAA
jgi:hypothetical protein